MKHKKDIGLLTVAVAIVAIYYGIKLASLTSIPYVFLEVYITYVAIGIGLLALFKRPLYEYLLVLLLPMFATVYPNYLLSSKSTDRMAIVTDKFTTNHIKSIGHVVELHFFEDNSLFAYENSPLYERVTIGDTCVVEWKDGIWWPVISDVNLNKESYK